MSEHICNETIVSIIGAVSTVVDPASTYMDEVVYALLNMRPERWEVIKGILLSSTKVEQRYTPLNGALSGNEINRILELDHMIKENYTGFISLVNLKLQSLSREEG